MPMSDNKKLAVIFDLGGVLIDWNPRHLYRKMFAGDPDKLEYFLSVVCPPAWNAEQDTGHSFAAAIAERAQLFPEYADYIQVFFKRGREMIKSEIPGSVAILSALREEGHPLYALSNWSAETYPYIAERFEFLNWFDDCIVSGYVDMVKPNREIFDYLLRRIQRDAQDCLFVDDSVLNIAAAEELGFRTILFTTAERLGAEMKAMGLLSTFDECS